MIIYRRILGVVLGFIGLFLLTFELMQFEISTAQWTPFNYANAIISILAGLVLMSKSSQKGLAILGGLLWVIATTIALYYLGDLTISDPNDGVMSILDWDWINYLNIIVSLSASYFLLKHS